jgi:uncharacterized Rossmann fold enzyme
LKKPQKWEFNGKNTKISKNKRHLNGNWQIYLRKLNKAKARIQTISKEKNQNRIQNFKQRQCRKKVYEVGIPRMK